MKQTNKKILFLTRLYYPHVGGVEKHVNKITRELLLKKMTVTIVTELYDTRLKRKEQHRGVTIYRIPVGKNIFFKKFFVWWWFLNNFEILTNSDVIHIHDVFYWVMPFRVFIPFKKIYVTFHGYEAYPVKKRWIVQRKIAEILTNGSICIGEFMKKWYKANPTKILYGGVDIPPKIKKEPNSASALFFGRLESQTNVMEYAKVMLDMTSHFARFKFTIVGEGPLDKAMVKYGKILPFDPKIDREIPDYNYIFVSRYLSILEALVSKRMVFAYFSDPLKEDYLKMTPFKKYIVIVKSERELREKLLYYEKNKSKKKELITAGYEWVKNQSWKKVTSDYLDLWGLRVNL